MFGASRHSREGGNPEAGAGNVWVPAFAGTEKRTMKHMKIMKEDFERND